MSSTPTKKRRILACMGDSLTNNQMSYPSGQGILQKYQYPSLLTQMIGGNCKELNLGIAGDTTNGMLSRISNMLYMGTPTVAIVYGGANDLGTSIPTQNNIQAMVTYLKNNGVQNILVAIMQASYNEVSPDTPSNQYHSVRVAQQAAATAMNVPVVDLSQISFTYNATPTAGVLTGAASPSTDISAISSPTLAIAVDQDVYPDFNVTHNITLNSTGLNTGTTIASTLQTAIRAISSTMATYSSVTVTYANGVYSITSGTTGLNSKIRIVPSAYPTTSSDIATLLGFGVGSTITDGQGNGDYLYGAHLVQSGTQKVTNTIKAKLDSLGWTTLLQN